MKRFEKLRRWNRKSPSPDVPDTKGSDRPPLNAVFASSASTSTSLLAREADRVTGPVVLSRRGRNETQLSEETVRASRTRDPRIAINPQLRASTERYSTEVRKFEELYGLYVQAHPNVVRVEIAEISSEFERVRHDLTLDDSSATTVVQVITTLLEKKESGTGNHVVASVGSFLLKFFPVVNLGLGLVQGIADIIEQEAGRGEQFIKQLKNLEFNSIRVSKIQEYPSNLIGDILKEKCQDLMTATIQFLRSSLLYFKHGFFCTSYLFPSLTGSVIYTDGLMKVEQAVREYDQALLQQVADHLLGAAADRDSRRARELNTGFLTWLSPSHWEVDDVRLKNSHQRTKGTLHWLFEMPELETWRGPNPTNHVLWLNGPPGIGKSTATAFIIDLLQGSYPDAILLYFFNKTNDPKLTHVSDIIRTFAYQLSQKLPYLQSEFSDEEFGGFQPTKSDSVSQLFRVLLQRHLECVSDEVFIVIDGLDQCNVNKSSTGSDVEELLSHLMALPMVRLLVTSRSTVEIAIVLDKYSKRLGPNENSADIGLYIRDRVASSHALSSAFATANVNPVDFLRTRAEGNFLWVTLVLSVAEKVDMMKKFFKAFEILPSEMHDVYISALEQVKAHGQETWVAEALGLITGADRDLEIPELKTALEASLDDKFIDFDNLLQSHTGSLLQIITDSSGISTVRLIHDSLRDFLTDPTLCKAPFFVDTLMIQGYIAEQCIRFLLTSFGTEGFARYAALYWMEHLHRSADEAAEYPGLVQLLHTFFLGDGIKHWIRTEIIINGEEFSAHFVHRIVQWVWNWCAKHEGDNRVTGETKIWRSSVVAKGMGNLHEHIGDVVGEMWLHGCFKNPDEIAAAFRLARVCVLVAAESKKGGFGWKAWYEQKKYGWSTGEEVMPEDITSLAERFGINNSNASCLAMIAITLALHKFLDKALDNMKAAAQIDPTFVRYYWWLGDKFERKRDNKTALFLYEESIREYPPSNNPDNIKKCQRMWGKHWVEKGDYAAANKVYNDVELLDVEEIRADVEHFARLCLAQKEWNYAINTYRNLVRHSPGGGLWAELGMAQIGNGEIVAAEDSYRREISNADGNLLALCRAKYLLAEVLARQTMYDEAINEYVMASSLVDSSENPGLYGELLLDLGFIYEQTGDRSTAIVQYSTSVEALLKSMENQYWNPVPAHGLGLLYARIGEPVKSEHYLRKAEDRIRFEPYEVDVNSDMETVNLNIGHEKVLRSWIHRKAQIRQLKANDLIKIQKWWVRSRRSSII